MVFFTARFDSLGFCAHSIPFPQPQPSSIPMVNLSAPDLTQHPPRSVRVRLGGYAHLSRLLDKARAVIGGKAGEFHYNCPLDQQFFAFTAIDHEVMLAEIKTGKTDVQMLEWVGTKTKRLPAEIASWSAWM